MNRREFVSAAMHRLAQKASKPLFQRLKVMLLVLLLTFTATVPFQTYAQGKSGDEGPQSDVYRKGAVQALEQETLLEEEPPSLDGVWRGLLNGNSDPDVWSIQFNEDNTYRYWVSGPTVEGSGSGSYSVTQTNKLSLNNTVVLFFSGVPKSFVVTQVPISLQSDRWRFAIQSTDNSKSLSVLFFSARVPSLGLMSNDDGDNAFRSGDPEESVDMLQMHMTDLANTGVQSLQYNVAAGVLYYPTSVGSRYAWKLSEANQTAIDCDDPPAWLLKCEEAYGVQCQSSSDHWVRTCWAHNVFLEGYDPVRIAGETFLTAGQTNGQEKRFFLSYRISDDHFAPVPVDYPLTTKFWETYQSTMRIGASGEPPIPASLFANGLENMLNFEKPQVRSQAVAEIKEAMTRYSDMISGIEIDFTRAPYLFPKDRAQANRDAMTGMIAEVRRYMSLLQGSAGISRPLYLIVRVPPTLGNAEWAGLDVPAWISQRLVDVVIPSHIMYLSQELNIEEFVSLASESGAVIYGGAPLRQNRGWRLDAVSPQDTYQNTASNAMPYPPAFYGAALNFYEAGAEGIQLYNMMAPSWAEEEWVHLFVKKLAQPKAQAIEAITDAAHEYFVTLPTLTSWEGYHEPIQQLPVYMNGGLQQFQNFEFNIQTDPSTQQNPPVLRIGLYQQLDDSKRFSLVINGDSGVDREPVSTYLIETNAVNDASKVANRAAATAAAPAAYLQLELDPELLHKGLNQISVSLEEPTSILDLRLSFPNACGPGESEWDFLLGCL